MSAARAARRTRSARRRPARAAAAQAPRRGRDEIVAAAAVVFTERGYAATSIDDVARQLGATKGRIYHHYRSKAQLFFEVHTAAMKLITDAVAPIAAARLAPAEKLRAMALEHARTVMRHFALEKVALHGLERHLLRGDATKSRMIRRVIRLRDGYEALFAAAIREGVETGVFKDIAPRLATKPVLGALNWLTIWFQPRRQATQDIDAIAECIAGFVVDGLRKEDAA